MFSRTNTRIPPETVPDVTGIIERCYNALARNRIRYRVFIRRAGAV